MGLRDRKKAETRQRISDEATLLFVTRGFDAVTVAEIAEAANVSKMTVFNYFPRKEDMFFDRLPEARELLLSAIDRRAAGVSPVEAIRDLALDLLRRDHPLGGAGDHRQFWRTVLASPALRAWLRESVEELESTLAGVLLEASPSAGAMRARWTAALVMAALRTMRQVTAQRILAGEDAAVVGAEQSALVNELFDGIERALAGPPA
ncbi:TetR/AcrR family transcriptional regulator [Cryptosporangium sp. NPDC051539]|uniref:TetR/AcrR family transcriptional regulator n=1 Tax=Cryptosporangium sp. NPDC051539 TaxID=3363962 RepID=UPI0037A4C5A5